MMQPSEHKPLTHAYFDICSSLNVWCSAAWYFFQCYTEHVMLSVLSSRPRQL